jgi:glycosyltransferase involved in cell wall biosynthesis
VSDRVRILRVIARLNIGGPALHATLLTERLDPARYESVVVAGSEADGEGNYLTFHGKVLPNLVALPALGRELSVGRDAVALCALVRLIRRVRPHIVHTHTAKAGTLGRLAASLCRVPAIVHTYHGHVLRGYFSPARTRLYREIERWLGRRTDRLLAVSERVRRELLDLGIGTAERFDVLPLGLDLDGLLVCDRRRGALRTELGVPDDAMLAGIVARLVPIKAHEVFLEAAAGVARARPDARFVIVGDGERRLELEALAARLGLQDRTYFLGWRRDLDRIYADLDVVALCSWNEGSPVSLIEAMAAGRPVVATRVGGVPDVVDDGVHGHLVDAGDGAGLAMAIVSLLRDPHRRHAMGQAGRARVCPAFDASRLVRDMDRLYTTLLAGKAA